MKIKIEKPQNPDESVASLKKELASLSHKNLVNLTHRHLIATLNSSENFRLISTILMKKLNEGIDLPDDINLLADILNTILKVAMDTGSHNDMLISKDKHIIFKSCPELKKPLLCTHEFWTEFKTPNIKIKTK
jgi:hypothetical protein